MRTHCLGFPVRSATVLVIFILLSALRASAQAPGAVTHTQLRSADSTRVRAELVRSTTLDPSLRSTVRAPDPSLTLLATTGAKEVAAQIGVLFARPAGPQIGFDVKASGPIDKNVDGTVVADLDGLRGTTVGEVGLTFHWWSPHADAKKFDAACDVLRTYWATDNDPKTELPKDECDSAMPGIPDSIRVQMENSVSWGIPFTFVARLTGGRTSFRYADTAAGFASTKTHRNARALKVATGTYIPRIGLVAVQYTRETSYKGADAVNLCTPLTGGASQCRETALSVPTEKSADIGRFTFRHYFSPTLGIETNISRDFSGNVTGVELPVYFLLKEKGGLNGGISIGWRSDDNDIKLTAFVGELLSPVIRLP